MIKGFQAFCLYLVPWSMSVPDGQTTPRLLLHELPDIRLGIRNKCKVKSCGNLVILILGLTYESWDQHMNLGAFIWIHPTYESWDATQRVQARWDKPPVFLI